MRWRVGVFLGALLAGCAEAGNPTGGTGGTGGASSSVSSSASGNVSSGASSSTSSNVSSGAGGADGVVVINEISAVGEDWVEIANGGQTPLDIGGYGLCDDAGGACDLTDVVRFPAGTMLAPGAYLLVVCDKPAGGGAGPFSDCLAAGGPSTCYHATWKVSASNGEMLHLVDANDQAVGDVLYPMDAVPDGRTWARLPDRTGDFAAAEPTPGAPNAAP